MKFILVSGDTFKYRKIFTENSGFYSTFHKAWKIPDDAANRKMLESLDGIKVIFPENIVDKNSDTSYIPIIGNGDDGNGKH